LYLLVKAKSQSPTIEMAYKANPKVQPFLPDDLDLVVVFKPNNQLPALENCSEAPEHDTRIPEGETQPPTQLTPASLIQPSDLKIRTDAGIFSIPSDLSYEVQLLC
jgi:hypothetical protein